MVDAIRTLKMKSIILFHALKTRDLEKINQILAEEFPIDSPITDTGMAALAAACSTLFD